MRLQRVLVGWFMALCAWLALPVAWRYDLFPGDAWLVTALGIWGTLWSFPILESWFPPPPISSPCPVPQKRMFLGWGMVILGTGLGALAVHFLWRRPVAWHLPLYLWGSGLILLLVGGYILDFGKTKAVRSTGKAIGWSVSRTWEWTAVVFTLAIGVFLRFHDLAHIPPGIFVDETNAAGDALRLLSGWPGSPFYVGWYETPLLYAYYMAALFKLFGVSYYTLKLASLIPAILTLVFFYPFVRELFGPLVALVALAFLVSSRWHLILSRWGWNELAPPVFYLATLWLLLRGSRTHHLGHFALAGLLLGLGMYTYLASRLLALTVFLYLIYRSFVDKSFLPRTKVGLLLFFLAYGLTFAPLATTYVRNPFTFLNRTRQVSIYHDMRARYDPEHPLPGPLKEVLQAVHLPTDISFQPLAESGVKHVRMFFVEGDHNPRHNIPGEPVLDPLTGALFLLGFAYAIRQWRDHRRGLLIFGVFVPLLGGVLTRVYEAPQAYRTLGVLPAVCVFAGDTLVRLAAVPYSLLPRKGRKWQGVFLVVVGVLVAGLINVWTFFHGWARDDRVWRAFSPTETAVAWEVRGAVGTYQVFLSPTLYWGSPLRFLMYGRTDAYEIVQPVEDLPLAIPAERDVLLILEPLYKDLLELFTAYYPHMRAKLVTGRGETPLFVRVFIPREDIEAVQGARVTYEDAAGNKIVQEVVREWRISHLQASRVLWEGSLFLPRSAVYAFRVVPRGEVWVDGARWTEPHMLGRGLHAFRVVSECPEVGGVHLEWQWGDKAWAPVPFTHVFLVEPPRHGVLGIYYRGDNWQGSPLFSRVDRTLLFSWPDPEPIPGPFSVTWLGYFFVPRVGSYRLRIDADDGVRLWVDNRVVAESLRPDTVNQVDVRLSLARGFHPLRVDYFQRGGGKSIRLYWQPPGEPERVIPPSFLVPVGKVELH